MMLMTLLPSSIEEGAINGISSKELADKSLCSLSIPNWRIYELLDWCSLGPMVGTMRRKPSLAGRKLDTMITPFQKSTKNQSPFPYFNYSNSVFFYPFFVIKLALNEWFNFLSHFLSPKN